MIVDNTNESTTQLMEISLAHDEAQTTALGEIISLLNKDSSSEYNDVIRERERDFETDNRTARQVELLEDILLELKGANKTTNPNKSSGILSTILGGAGILGAGILGNIFNPLKLIFSVFDSMKTGLIPITTAIGKLGIVGGMGGIGKIISKIFWPIHTIFSAIGGIMDAFDDESLADKLNKDIGAITNIDRIFSFLYGFVSRLVGGLIDPILKLFGIDFSVENVMSEGFGYIQRAISNATLSIQNNDFDGWVNSIWESTTDVMKASIMKMIDSISNAAADATDGIIDWLRGVSWLPDWAKTKLPETRSSIQRKEQAAYDAVLKSRTTASTRVSDDTIRLQELQEREDVTIQSLGVAFKQSIDSGMDPENARRIYETNVARHKSEFSAQRADIVADIERNSEVIIRPLPSKPISSSIVESDGIETKESVSRISRPSTGNVDVDGLLDMIGKKESGGNYNALVYGKNTPKSADLTNMTISEVFDYQSGMIDRGHASTAVGKYQFIHATLREAVSATGLSGNDKFSPENQDKLAVYLLNRRGLRKLQSGEITDKQFAHNLSKEWASIPTSEGKSFYDGIAGNRSSGSYSDLISSINGTGMNGNRATTNNTAGISSTPSDIHIIGAQSSPINNGSMINSGVMQISLRNDEPSFKRAIEDLAFSSIGTSGTPFNY